MSGGFENARLAITSIAENRLRSFLTTLGIIFGVMAVIAVVSIVQGVFYVYTSQLEGLGAGFMFVIPGNNQATGKVRANPRLSKEDADALARLSGEVDATSNYFFDRRMVTRRGEKTEAVVAAITENYQEVQNHFVDEGRFITRFDVTSRARNMVIGPELAEDLGLGRAIGAKLRLYGSTFTVVGVMEKKDGVNFMGQPFDRMAVIPYTTAQGFASGRGGGLVLLRLKSVEDVERSKEAIRRTLRTEHALRRADPDDFQIMSQSDLLGVVGNITGLATGVVVAIVAVALLVGGIGIMNIMLVSVTERTREIGIRKALGARRRDILAQFLTEAAALGLLGGIFGIGLGYGMAYIATLVVPELPPPVVPFWSVAMAFVFSASVGVFFGAYPAHKASQLDPIDALRYE